MMKWLMLVATILLIAPAAPAKTSHSPHSVRTNCLSHAYDVESMLKCGNDEFSAPDFTVTPSLCRGETIGVAIMGFRNANGAGTHLLAKKVARSCRDSAYVKWADSRRCPQLNSVQNSRAKLAFPRQLSPADREIAEMDGSYYKVELSGFYPKERASVGVTLTGNDISPVGKWVVAALKAMQPCWSSDRPAR